MPARKKRTDALRIAALEKQLAATEEVADAQSAMIFDHASVVTVLTERLEAAQMLVQIQSDTIRRHVPELVELQKQLAAKDKELEGAYRNAAGVSGTIEFLWEEIDRYRNRLMGHISWDAMLPDDVRTAVQKVRTEAYAWEHDEDETVEQS